MSEIPIAGRLDTNGAGSRSSSLCLSFATQPGFLAPWSSAHLVWCQMFSALRGGKPENSLCCPEQAVRGTHKRGNSFPRYAPDTPNNCIQPFGIGSPRRYSSAQHWGCFCQEVKHCSAKQTCLHAVSLFSYALIQNPLKSTMF